MLPPLLLLAALVSPAPAGELPSIDTPLRTGLSAKGDAAVVIGVENYVYLPAATYAVRDAEAMYQFLVYTRGVPASRVTKLTGGTSRGKIRDAVEAAGESVGPGGTVWVYFAGHGSASPSTRGRLLLPENTLAEAEGFDEAGVPVADLQRLAGAGGGEVMLITDACFTGAGRQGDMLLSGGRSFVPGSSTAAGKTAQWDAAQPNQVAGPLHAVQHGAFTYFAIGAMRGWADGQVTGARDGVVTSEEAQLYVDASLKAIGMRDQDPSLVGATAFSRTLASGATERAPALDAAVQAPVSSSASGTSFGSVGAVSVEEKLREQACDDDARTKTAAARAARLAALVSAKEAEATAAWQTLRPGAEACVKLADRGPRAECAAKVEGFARLAGSAQVTLTAGDEVVPTACGARTRTFGAETRSVTVGELASARELAAQLRESPAAAANAPVPASSSTSSSTGGLDWTSPTLGLMKWIPAGSFTMGSAEGVGVVDEHPAHQVTLTRGYWLMEHEVTQGEWSAVMGSDPSYFSSCGASCPVEQVSWEDAQAFIKKVSTRDGVSYRLPTEAEWEYAARGGQSDEYAGNAEPEKVAWTDGNSGRTTHPVCGKARNRYGLCDMSGNVWEWVADWRGRYPSGAASDPTGPAVGSKRVFRGGSWNFPSANARVANRRWSAPGHRWSDVGLRLALAGP
jgi:formylglycine-generating enzyme required for sulfatase activity/uncharacterized caspase-like protein